MDQGKTILVVDDDSKIRNLLRRCLEADGHTVVEASNALEVDAQISAQNIDLITLDLQLGKDNGLTIASALRDKSDVPIVMVTGKGDLIDKVVGLEVGADDYIAKPFHIREVQARIRSVLRRSELRQSADHNHSDLRTQCDLEHKYMFSGWVADPARQELLTPNKNVCDLTTTDFKLLMIFLDSPKRILSRDHIMDSLNGNEWTPYDRTVDNQVARLRKKIEIDANKPSIIKTVRGVGYMFTSDVEKSPR
jgi:DNA-binding response OmpR family regulator